MPWLDKMKDLLSSTPLQVLSRMILGGIFIYASLNKIAQPLEFAKIIKNYQILPDFLITLPALVLPWLEFLAGFCLLAGLWKRSAAILLSLLLLIFIVALGINAFRGIDLSCGCFSTTASDTENIYILLLRDLLILIPGLLVIFFQRENS